jgi:hypothetical protein
VCCWSGRSRRWPPNTTCSAPTRWAGRALPDPQEHPHGAGDRNPDDARHAALAVAWGSSRATWAAGWMT